MNEYTLKCGRICSDNEWMLQYEVSTEMPCSNFIRDRVREREEEGQRICSVGFKGEVF